MSDSKKVNDGGIPKHLVNQLGEHTIGGFILFYFNSETGEPEQLMTFDSPAHSLALQKYISDWNEAIHAVNIDNSICAIQQSIIEASKEAGEVENDDEDDE